MSSYRGNVAVTAQALRLCVLAICGATLAGVAAVSAGICLVAGAAPHDALVATPSTALTLLGHNAPVALWPLALIAIGWPALPGVRTFGDLLVTVQLVSHGLVVGSQIGQHPDLWRYLPHLPVEWLAIAAASAAWLHARTRAPTDATDARGLALIAAACLVALVIAAVIETYLVPIA